MPVPPVGRAPEAGGPNRPRGVDRPFSAPPASGGRASPDDEVRISEEAEGQLRIHELVKAVREAVAGLPETREERVAEARARVAEGYYDRADVRGSVADALLSAFRAERR